MLQITLQEPPIVTQAQVASGTYVTYVPVHTQTHL